MYIYAMCPWCVYSIGVWPRSSSSFVAFSICRYAQWTHIVRLHSTDCLTLDALNNIAVNNNLKYGKLTIPFWFKTRYEMRRIPINIVHIWTKNPSDTHHTIWKTTHQGKNCLTIAMGKTKLFVQVLIGLECGSECEANAVRREWGEGGSSTWKDYW